MSAPLPAPGRIVPRSMSHVLMFEFLLVLIVLGVVIGFLIREIPAATDKAGFTEVLMASRKGQIEMMERLAISGSAMAAASAATMSAGPPAKPEGRFALSRLDQDGLYRLTGTRPNRGTPFSLSFAPSVIQDEPAGSVLWLCGRQRPPAGWSGPANGPGSDLSAEELPFVCRHHGG